MYRFFFLLVLLSTPIFADSVIKNCDSAGRLTIEKPTAKDSSVYAKGNQSEWFHVDGTWNQGVFTSDDMIFLENRDYDVRIELPDDGGHFLTSARCPGLTFSCKPLEIDIERCVTDGYRYYVYFYMNNSEYSDLNYVVKTGDGKEFVKGPARTDPTMENFILSPLGYNHYLAGYRADTIIQTISITHELCDQKVEPYYTYVTMACMNKSCNRDDDCNSNEYCAENLCEMLNCRQCENITNHKCKYMCDDDNPCTNDRCSFDTCTNTQEPGCQFLESCLSYGEEINYNELPSYCSKEGILSKKEINNSCDQNYECLSGFCNIRCSHNVTGIRVQKSSIFDKIVSFFLNLF